VKTPRASLVPLAAILISACASSTPQELLNARTAYDRASAGPAAQLAPADLHTAKETLGAAEQSFADHGDSPETRDIAYAAERRAELADVHARTAAAVQARTNAVAQLDALKDQQVRLTSAQLSVATQQLQAEGQQLQTETERRQRAERRAAQTAADLARIASSVKQDERGLVITLSGGVLFESAKSDLMGTAQAKLSEVADALTKQDPDSRILIQGYTDSQGSLSFNQDLSQRRAEAVRSYLVSHGIAADRITAQGFGPSNPVASNASPEGRADNRRVEIIVQNHRGMGTTTP
jgi:outer membrane protein OmpA-like peptidoglycan-associated protein